ncbi:bifunctional phosphoribosyl-AMP cyclohydrolase/phosphoribosyl-ATP diphosphatase HisIE [Christensenella tenuis]|jgi:phosphoribosyl-AMP cyclohydrolase / phosphoribosyl-ATP pyrophosphohydrolase|nr:bifunctional phosphoribosyl-AMP cyclohydrolase/phosphoribosyl-ATP diphosphatase HisIE [Christensenella tenuis]
MEIKFDEKGLVPAIAQEARTGAVLMQAYMNQEAFDKTLETGYAHYYSRSRKKLWKKGETSGNVQKVVSVSLDCDGDCVLLKVEQTGVACHTGEYSCFFNCVQENDKVANSSLLYELYDLIADRKVHPKEGSYTNYLFEKGIDKILKKIGEESAEVIIASKNPGTSELQYEAADLIYHLLVLMNEKGLSLTELFGELQGRR